MNKRRVSRGTGVVLLSHGGGGSLTQRFIQETILPRLGNPVLNELDDGALIRLPSRGIAFSTDSFVVRPLFFPGGDIGRLAVFGTANDLAMMGAKPRYLSLGLIIEEGFPMSDLERVIASIAGALKESGMILATGDTKVVERGAGFGVFANTSGIGVRMPGMDTRVCNAEAGDAVIVTGTLGDHGGAVIACREGIAMAGGLSSDAAPLWSLVQALATFKSAIHCLRDPTRGGLAAALCDIAASSRAGIRVRESALPVKRQVGAVCSLLGLDVLNMACEGRAVVVCRAAQAEKILTRLRAHPLGRRAAIVGDVVAGPSGRVTLETRAGGERLVDMPMGEDLPRIC